MNSAVERAIVCIWERYDEELSLSEIAESAILSRFHFCRIFKDATGVSPVRFLSAVRIYHAKRMLATTSMNVTDISFAVGYNSLGSFTNHFTDSVGVSPGRFRRLLQNRDLAQTAAARQPSASSARGKSVVEGTIRLAENFAAANVYVGAFSTPIVQCRPAASTVIEMAAPERARPYRLSGISEGEWFIHAVAVADSVDPEPWTRRALLVCDHEPVRVTAGRTECATMALRPRRPTDLPILFALPGLSDGADEMTLPAAGTARATEIERDYART